MFEAEKKAFKEGKDIQVFNENVGHWRLTTYPRWREDRQYRIKPDPESKGQ
jgi:hypothetical protein